MKLYPCGGVRQLLPLSPYVLIVTAAGARWCFAARPRVAGLVVTLFTAITLSSAPTYYQYTRSTLNRASFNDLTRRAGTGAVVSADGDYSALPLRYLGRTGHRIRIIPSYYPEFAKLIRQRRTFLLMSFVSPVVSSTPHGWRLNPGFVGLDPSKLALEQYEVEPLLHGGEDSLSNPLPAFVFRPRFNLAGSAE